MMTGPGGQSCRHGSKVEDQCRVHLACGIQWRWDSKAYVIHYDNMVHVSCCRGILMFSQIRRDTYQSGQIQ